MERKRPRQGYKSAAIAEGQKGAMLSYRDSDLCEEYSDLSLHMKDETGCKVEVYADGVLAGSWEGDIRHCKHRSALMLDRLGYQVEKRNRHRRPIYEEIEIDLSSCRLQPGSEIRLRISGEIRLCFWKMLKGKAVGENQPGVAN